MLVMVFAFAGTNALACEGCDVDTKTDILTDIYTPPLNYYQEGSNGGEDSAFMSGAAGYSHDIEARGSSHAFAQGNGQGDMYGFGGAFQKEIRNGELSGAGALTIAVSDVNGRAHGHDAECNSGPDYAKVDLEVKGTALQMNQAFSDDRQSFIGGNNFSRVDYWGQTDKYDYGTNDRWEYEYQYSYWKGPRERRGDGYYTWRNPPGPDNAGYYKRVHVYDWVKYPDLTADAYDSIKGIGLAGGGTLVWAKQTDTKATVAGITGNFATALYCGAEYQHTHVQGDGTLLGAAQLPGVGYAQFSASFDYNGHNFGAGVAGGISNVEISQSANHTSVTSSTTAFSSATVGGHRNFDVPQ